jgi:hypothetical protein
MRNRYNAQQWIKELIKNEISEPFTRKDLVKLNLDKPAYFFNIAHRNGWIKKNYGNQNILYAWVLTDRAKQLLS